MLGLDPKQFPEIAGTCAGSCIVAAGAACVWDDLIALDQDWDVMTVNDITMHFPGVIAHAFSYDAPWLAKWVAARRELLTRKYGPIGAIHSNNRPVEHFWPWPGQGTSALGAVYTALALGYKQIVLCGVPLDDSPHYFDPPWARCNFTREVGTRGEKTLRYWNPAVLAGVTSMSGRTRELLGSPT